MFDLIPTKPANCLSPSGGHIQVIFGPMFSGKTTELIRRLKRYQIANHTCLIVKYAHDIRYSKSSLVTHDKQSIDAVSTLTLKELLDDALNYSVIGIDEGQFFPDILYFAEELANKGKIVIVAALDGTYKQEGFGDILDLIPLAESVMKLTAVCMICFENACYTKRIGSETELEVIGGADKYMAVCRSCNNKSIAAQKNISTSVLCDISNNQGMKINSVENI